MKLAYIVLAHRDPENVVRLVSRLVDGGGLVAVHYDRKASAADHAALRDAFRQSADVLIVDPIDVRWGRWSIVQATLDAIAALEQSNWVFDYVHLMSGMDYPIKPIGWFEQFLTTASGHEFIETKNINRGTWVQGGLEHERYTYQHVHNWQAEQKKFDKHWARQRKQKRVRKFLEGYDPCLGSQWWTLTWKTCLGALAWSRIPAVRAFFETVWIPDEMFFQTYVGNNLPPEQIWNIHLTYYQFDPNGIPVVFYDDHLNYVISQGFFFARKFHPRAKALRDGIDAHVTELTGSPLRLDENFGRRTSEYAEFVEKHRKGLPNRRQVGYTEDAWYGDLKWNRAHFIVIAVTARATGERVRAAIAASGVAVCHGELFARNTIEFAGGADRFAGYGAGDVALRDQKPHNFLVDLVRASSPLITCFVMCIDNSSELQKVLIWDPHAHFVFAPADVVDSFLEEGEGPAREEKLQDSLAFALLSRKLLSGNEEFASLAMKLKHARKAPHVAYGHEWRHHLRKFISGVIDANLGEGIGTPMRLAGLSAGMPLFESPSHVMRFLKLAEAVTTPLERDRVLEGYLSPIEDRDATYLTVVADSPVDENVMSALSDAFDAIAIVTVVFASGDDGGDSVDAPRDKCTILAPRYRLEGIDTADAIPLVDAFIKTPRSMVVVLKSKSADDQAGLGQRGHDENNAGRRVYELGRLHRKFVRTINLGEEDWRTDIKSVAVIAQARLQEFERAELAAKWGAEEFTAPRGADGKQT